jgi:hypothetical protein
VNLVPDDCYPDKNVFRNSIWAAFLVLNIFVGLIGNLLTLLSIPYATYHNKFGFSGICETTTIYILNLALCDFLICAISAPSSVLMVIYHGWPFTPASCAMTVWIRYAITAADWQALSLIALSRCVLLKWPKKGKAIFNGKSALVVIGFSWLTILGFLLLMAFEVVKYIFIFIVYLFLLSFEKHLSSRIPTSMATVASRVTAP